MLIQFFLILGFVLALWITWKRYRQNIISLIEALLWSLLWLGGAVVALLPKLTEYLANVFGVGRGVDLMLYAAVAIQFFLIFKLFISHEKLERLLTKLVQAQSLSVIPAPCPQPATTSQMLVGSVAGGKAGIQQEKQNTMDPRVSSDDSLEDDKSG